MTLDQMRDPKRAMERAWNARYNQKIEQCLENFIPLKPMLGLPSGQIAPHAIAGLIESTASTRDPARYEGIFEGLALSASLARAHRDFEYSRKILAAIQEASYKLGIEPGVRVRFELGLTSFMDGEWTRALEEFHSVRYGTERSLLWFYAQINAILCMENLGIPFDSQLMSLESEVREFKPSSSIAGVLSQLTALKAREAVRAGEFSKVLTVSRGDGGQASQMDYFRLWVGSLPYAQPRIPIDLAAFSERSRSLHQGEFRLRTLQGLLHPDDIQGARFTDMIERIYLWVWNWLGDPDQFPIARVLQLLKRFEGRTHRINCEDYLQLRNALLWIGLFAEDPEDRVLDRLSRLASVPQARSSCLDFERLLLAYLYARRDRNTLFESELLPQLKSHEQWSNPNHCLASLVEHVAGRAHPLAKLAGNLERLIAHSSRSILAKTTVRLPSGEIHDAKTGSKTISQALALAIYSLWRRPTLSCEELALACFGISRYDSSVHEKKIHNLIFRLKQRFGPQLKFRFKSGFVHAEGDWNGVGFDESARPSRELLMHGEWRGFLVDPGTQAPTPLPAHAPSDDLARPEWAGRWLTRSEIEQGLRRPRSTVNRALARWVSEGKVQKKGSARNTVYRFKRERN